MNFRSERTISKVKATLHTDGGSRGNPGPAGIGVVIKFEDGRKVEHSEYIGETTNNQAEYQALVRGLKEALSLDVTELSVFMDSELIVKQVNGEYRVKNAELRPWFEQVEEVKKEFSSVSFGHVKREKNKEADKLVNKALDSEGK